MKFFFKTIQLQCAKNFNNCSELEVDGQSVYILYVLYITVGAFGSLFNWLCYYVLSTMNGAHHLNRKFTSTMKLYTLNSFLYCLNQAINCVVILSTFKTVYQHEDMIFQLFPSYEFVFYYVYVNINLSVLHYTFGGIMDIYIAYTRIQIFKSNYTFLSRTSVILTSTVFTTFCCC